MPKTVIHSPQAPQAIGTYSQAIKIDQTVYLSGQIPLDPIRMELVEGDIRDQITQVFKNLRAVAQAAGGSLADIVKLNVYLTDLTHFHIVNEVMLNFFCEPFPARAVVCVAALPKHANVEIDGIMIIEEQEYK